VHLDEALRLATTQRGRGAATQFVGGARPQVLPLGVMFPVHAVRGLQRSLAAC
jgi:hypothetical protein